MEEYILMKKSDFKKSLEELYKYNTDDNIINHRSGKISFNGTVFYRLDMVVKAVEKNYIPKNNF